MNAAGDGHFRGPSEYIVTLACKHTWEIVPVRATNPDAVVVDGATKRVRYRRRPSLLLSLWREGIGRRMAAAVQTRCLVSLDFRGLGSSGPRRRFLLIAARSGVFVGL
jgi:hypothetical protein